MGIRYALIIANFTYDYLGNLKAPRYDAKKLKEVLNNQKLGDFKCKLLIDKEAGYIRNELEKFYKKNHDDTLLLYYSGHGIRENRNDLYLSCKDTNKDKLQNTSITVDYINKLIKYSNSSRNIIILDCCFSGAMGLTYKSDSLNGIYNETIDYINYGNGTVILSSCSNFELSYEQDNISNYTNIFVEGIKSGNADIKNRGYITTGDIHDYICDIMEKNNLKQKPRRKCDIYKDIIISKVSVQVEDFGKKTDEPINIDTYLDSNNDVYENTKKILPEKRDYYRLNTKIEFKKWIFSNCKISDEILLIGNFKEKNNFLKLISDFNDLNRKNIDEIKYYKINKRIFINTPSVINNAYLIVDKLKNHRKINSIIYFVDYDNYKDLRYLKNKKFLNSLIKIVKPKILIMCINKKSSIIYNDDIKEFNSYCEKNVKYTKDYYILLKSF